ncbi:MAG TPA: TonB family protein [Casimicrobiaceae bacterium]|nr:TonB family protein [Casimicrobiaceae bacterium]
MDFARQQRDPKKHLIGLTAVILLHVIIIYGLMTGLARKAIEVIKKPVSATVVEEIKKPPPPPPPPPPKRIEPPKVTPPIQTYVPPPDIPPPPQIVEQPTITAIAPEPPKEPYIIAPPAPPVVEAPPPKPAIQAAAVVCPSQEKPSYPREAIRANIERGEVTATLSIDASGNVTSVEINQSSPPRVFDRVVRDTLGSWKCVGQGQAVKARAIITFKLAD